jgi:hypothetical protein
MAPSKTTSWAQASPASLPQVAPVVQRADSPFLRAVRRV